MLSRGLGAHVRCQQADQGLGSAFGDFANLSASLAMFLAPKGSIRVEHDVSDLWIAEQFLDGRP
jgi:hypothetical protein